MESFKKCFIISGHTTEEFLFKNNLSLPPNSLALQGETQVLQQARKCKQSLGS